MQLSVLQYLEQPSLLSEVTLDEVLSLADRFPYATTLHLLVLLKARQINSPDFEKYLNRFAASTFDRAHLYNFLATLERQDADGGEVLELLQLEDLELAPLAAELDFLWEGDPLWRQVIETDQGTLTLNQGGAIMEIDGTARQGDSWSEPGIPGEYDGLYARFADLLARRASEVDLRPMTLVADAFTLGRRIDAPAFTDPTLETQDA